MKKRWLIAGIAVACVVVGILACSSDSASGPSAYYDPSGRDDGGSGGAFPDASVGVASGVVLVHAAAFPPFRVCFENYPELRPQPESRPMPNANVVGVEIGSMARIPPLDRAPGRVFVIDEGQVRSAPGSRDDPRCRERICPQGNTDGPCLRPLLDYLVAGEIGTPLGTDRVHVLALAGCGNAGFLGSMGIPTSECGEGWDQTNGSLMARAVPLLPTSAATDTALPVQLVHLSTPIDTFQRSGRLLEISFGALEGGSPQPIATSLMLFDTSTATTLDVDQTREAFYGSHGFRITLTPEDGGADAGAISVVQSLAEVQDLAEPRSVPTTYYRAASNYALLLLGDPRIERTLPDGGANRAYDARRGVHLLAVPVKDPSDAGADSGAIDAAGD